MDGQRLGAKPTQSDYKCQNCTCKTNGCYSEYKEVNHSYDIVYLRYMTRLTIMGFRFCFCGCLVILLGVLVHEVDRAS